MPYCAAKGYPKCRCSPEQRRRVLDAISSGRLRLDAPGKMYAAYGVGRACAGCDDVIGPDEVEYEAHYAEGLSYYLHLGCAALWNTQVRGSPEATIGDARTIRDRSQAARQQARLTSKHSAQLLDRADVVARESEEAIEKARRAKRREPPGG